jgi:hypothetical protein
MSKGYFTENISDETLANLIDETLRFEKAQKNKQSKLNLFRILSTVAAIILVVGLINLVTTTLQKEPIVEPNNGNGILPNANIYRPSIEEFTDIIKETKDYSHVRFGKTRNTLLLEVEWFTYDEYLDYIEEQKVWFADYQVSDYYMQSSEKVQKHLDDLYTPEFIEKYIDNMQKILSKIEKQEVYLSRTVNGKYSPDSFGFWAKDKWLYLDSDGYYICKVYPYIPSVIYYDENDDRQIKEFIKVYDKEEYENLLKKIIIPYCNNLVERGVLSQESYDFYITLDPLDYYVNWLF